MPPISSCLLYEGKGKDISKKLSRFKLRRTILAPCSETSEYAHIAFLVFRRNATYLLSKLFLMEKTL